MDAILWTLGLAYLLRAAYTAGVIKSWLRWSGEPYDAFRIVWCAAFWPSTILRGWLAQRRD